LITTLLAKNIKPRINDVNLGLHHWAAPSTGVQRSDLFYSSTW